MTTVQLNADILRNLGIIAEDESMLERVAKYVRKLAKQMTEDPVGYTGRRLPTRNRRTK